MKGGGEFPKKWLLPKLHDKGGRVVQQIVTYDNNSRKGRGVVIKIVYYSYVKDKSDAAYKWRMRRMPMVPQILFILTLS